MNLRDNKLIVGIITGILVPVLAYGLWTLFFYTLTALEITRPDTLSATWRARTIALLSICANLIPFNLHKKANNDESMRGLVFPTVTMVGIWVYVFWDVIFQS